MTPEPTFAEAVRIFWETRAGQTQRQAARGVDDQGARSAVTGGRQMDGFVAAIRSSLVRAGTPTEWIQAGRRVPVLPGFYRPTKEWDITIVQPSRGANRLVAAIELKSQVGPSFGNNFNNRAEEALGSAVDLWAAYREGAFGEQPTPFLGYVFLLEECPASTKAVHPAEPFFEAFPEFREASYARRYELLCRKLVRERHYSSAAYLTSERPARPVAAGYTEPASDLTAGHFLSALGGHVEAFRG